MNYLTFFHMLAGGKVWQIRTFWTAAGPTAADLHDAILAYAADMLPADATFSNVVLHNERQFTLEYPRFRTDGPAPFHHLPLPPHDEK